MVKVIAGVTAGVIVVAGAVWLANSKTPREPKVTAASPPKAVALRKFITEHAKTTDKKQQDSVATARIQLAYDHAVKKEYKAARKVLQTAAAEYRGTKTMNPDFGSLDDQARYQAAVCLVADGQPDAARKEFIKFMKERPTSPLVHDAFRRLVRLDDGNIRPEYQALLEDGMRKQAEIIKFETSVCGPKAI